MIHSTRGNGASAQAEFDGTVAWFASPASQVSAHIVIAADGTIARCVDPAYTAWHAMDFNTHALGAELCQPKIGDHITDAQLASLGWWLKQMATQFGFALTLANLPEHRDLASGKLEGKTDVGSDYSFDRLAPYLS